MKTIVVVAVAILAVGGALRCHQGKEDASLRMQGEPLDCLANSRSCIFVLDHTHKEVTRACQMANCTQGGVDDGVVVSQPTCANRTGSALEWWPHVSGPETYCCCYGDGCNADVKEIMNPGSAVSRTNLAGSIARRIEDFYDRDASAAERTFLRRVVKHVYERIEQ